MTIVDHTSTVAAFPLGGIGTGTVSLGSRGQLRDWELANHPDKGNDLPFTFFAIHAAPHGEVAVSRVLEAALPPPHDFEEGYATPRLAGLPRLAGARLRGEYPIAELEFDDDVLPVAVALTAFTPFIPLETADSGIPGAILRYRVVNTRDVPVRVTIAGSLSNPVGSRPSTHAAFPAFDGTPSIERVDDGVLRGLRFGTDLPRDDVRHGSVVLGTTDPSTTSKRQWLVGFWQDGSRSFWNDFADDGLLEDEPAFSLDTDLPPLLARQAGPGAAADLAAHLTKLRVGSLGIVHELAPGEERDFEFVVSWSFPNRPTGWVGHVIRDDPNAGTITRNHYATRFADAWESARYLTDELPRLEAGTRAFHTALHGGTLDPAVVDAVSATLVALRSTTCFLLEDGTFAAWEGSFDHTGSCEGTCTHVWNYAQSVAHLFPELERGARRIEFLLETDHEGAMQFRTNRIFGGPSWGMLPAVDGQLGTIVRLYREWSFSGDDSFLRELWPAARRALDFALREWDTDGDGLLDAEMHNTYDIEFDGVEPLANVWLIAALRAAEAMARHLGETEVADDYARAADRTAGRVDEELFTGEYYRQRVDDVDARRYQYGDGVLSDQLLGQSIAHTVGLGYLLPAEHVRDAVGAIYRHNFRSSLRDHESTQRTYALGDEGGLLLASWPYGGRPRIPFIYSDEVWTGIEYQVAAHLATEGLVAEALSVVRTTRARHDGRARNPWNEAECGNHYARSMASWSVLIALSGYRWHAPTNSLSFSPAQPGPFRCFFSTGSGWGRVSIDDGAIELALDHGTLDLDELSVRGREVALPNGALRLSAGEVVRLELAGPVPRTVV